MSDDSGKKKDEPKQAAAAPKPSPDQPHIETLEVFSKSRSFTEELEKLRSLPLYLYTNPLGDYFAKDTLTSTNIFDPTLGATYDSFSNELNALRKRVEDQARQIANDAAAKKNIEGKARALESDVAQLRDKERINFLLNRVSQSAQLELLESEEFRKEFLGTKERIAFVMSVDIRRSTELMLKARSPEAFAQFITSLCAALSKVITDSYGVFDKFTGDGVLAFFPDFYSGEDAAYHVINVADACHATFDEHYKQNRKLFTTVLTDIGLGIGIDYGSVHLVQVAGGLTVVGVPVVYACRLSCAPPGTTLANQPAYEVISERCGAQTFVKETQCEIKHEGNMLAYEIRLNERPYSAEKPAWETRHSARASAKV